MTSPSFRNLGCAVFPPWHSCAVRVRVRVRARVRARVGARVKERVAALSPEAYRTPIPSCSRYLTPCLLPQGKALIYSAKVCLVRIAMSAYEDPVIANTFKSTLATQPEKMTYKFVEMQTREFFNGVLAATPDALNCQLITVDDMRGAIILTKYFVQQHLLASNQCATPSPSPQLAPQP